WILGREGKAISIVGRFQMLDNLRRSLTSPMILFLFIAFFCIPTHNNWIWIVLSLVALALPPLMPFFSEIIFYKNKNVSIREQLRIIYKNLFLGMNRFLLNVIMLPHNSRIYLDAIFRTIYRMTISKKKLLEWTTAAAAKSSASLKLKSFFSTVTYIEIFSLLLLLLITFIINPIQFNTAIFFIILWSISPYVSWKISLPPSKENIRSLNEDEIFIFRETARRIWRFFTIFVNEKENFLPPDNFQEDPVPIIAHRSSPTNFGLYLLSIIAARDFGWIGIQEMVHRLENTLNSMKKLPRHQGHFFNWYQTNTGNALEPRYISSVDNGNLTGHLIVAQELKEILKRPLIESVMKIGISNSSKGFCKDSLRLLKDSIYLSKLSDEKRNLIVDQAQIIAATDELEKHLLMKFNDDQISEKISYWETLSSKAETLVDLAKTFAAERDETTKCEILNWSKLIEEEITSHVKDLAFFGAGNAIFHTKNKIKELINICSDFINEMDFNFLYDHSRKLFSIGFRMPDNSLDNSYYDLLASEARLLSFIAIAKGDISSKHWFRLGRALTKADHGAVLFSWSGSMFEYLMPSLVMNTPVGSLLEQTCKLVVKRQILYGEQRSVPWGVSESAYNERDIHFTYQYSNFGVPGLGLKRGLVNDLVIAPYATILAAMYDSVSAVKNLKRLLKLSACGLFGFYEAIDFTKERLPENKEVVVVKTYMTHHQGMSLISIANVLYDGIFRKRFHLVPMVQATELLLQERTPTNVIVEKPTMEASEVLHVESEGSRIARHYYSAESVIPRTHLLSNGNYVVMVTSAGSGYSRFRGINITRWREDVTRDHYGSYIFLSKSNTANKSNKKISKANPSVWSAGIQPIVTDTTNDTSSSKYEVIFTEDRVKITREVENIVSELEIYVSAEDNAEIRRLYLTNNSSEITDIEVTSYAEVVLNSEGADLAHPVFSNLFVQTEYAPDISSIIVNRRPRSQKESTVWLAHVIATDLNAIGEIEYETDRSRFIGRGRSIKNPISVFDGKPLSNTVGSVLDPIISLRTRVRIAPGNTAKVTYSTAIALEKNELLNLADKLRDDSTFERISNLAWTQAQVTLHYLGIEHNEANLFQELANRVLFSDSSLRSSSEILKRNSLDISSLWAHDISGDHPIVLIRIDNIEEISIVRQLLRAHEYWGSKRLIVDLIILNEKRISYSQELHESLEAMVKTSIITSRSYLSEGKGKVFVLQSQILSAAEVDLLQTVARAILIAGQGSLAEQVKKIPITKIKSTSFSVSKTNRKQYFINRKLTSFGGAKVSAATTTNFFYPPQFSIPTLDFYNGLGGFADKGKEYIIHLKKGQHTPAPWINVISNNNFGFQVSECGAGFTWSINSRENQITPWSNDPVCDPSGECFYLFDNDSGDLWSPTSSPIRIEDAEYLIHHGQGYSRFEFINSKSGIYSDLTQFVHWKESVKISKITIKNLTKKKKNISIFSYIEWVLGFSRTTTSPYIVTELLDDTTNSKVILAYNSLNKEFAKRISFATFLGGNDGFTCDRSEFLGRNGNTNHPQIKMLSEKIGIGFDPCGAIQKDISLKPGQSITIAFLLGQADDRQKIKNIIESLYQISDINNAFKEVIREWDNILTKIQVETPDPSMNIILNRWSLYQSIVCRLWARSAFYQASGAFGFRDQLQDSLALIWSRPDITRAHIIYASSRQFIEGDVQHWWHVPSGRGVRTHCSDDLLWLPFVVSHYLQITKDYSILDEQVPFLEGAILNADQEDSYFTPIVSKVFASLYEHCARAIDHSLNFGKHGLPLIGSGDWNDGMNRVGREGQGESVWLAWFLYANLNAFSKIATERKHEIERAERWIKLAQDLKTSIEKEAWDGNWYLRAFFDDGTALGSSSNLECKIDSIAQSWGVISGATAIDTANTTNTANNIEDIQIRTRVEKAMESVEQFLIKSSDNLVLLFTPPFDKTTHDPGYIKGYLPGVRENGGQYSHAAIWCIYAYVGLGKGQNAVDLFSMINPINHSSTRAKVYRYKVEPYVLAADIYSEAPYVGRGGWSWYTGSAAWMYRAGIESILGFKLTGDKLQIEPNIHPEW
ncbi:MAG: phosphorylase, partial [Oligoflexia bacterium]|nr:phosphorylase [Oligoflexia bacterium]